MLRIDLLNFQEERKSDKATANQYDTHAKTFRAPLRVENYKQNLNRP